MLIPTTLLLLAALLPGSASVGPPPATNVLFIAVDDLRPEHGVFGGAALTPNIDAFAKTATTFKRNYVQLAVCSPTRTSLLTGRYPDTTHISDLYKYFRSEGCNVTTLPQAFREAGYTTVGAGKIFHPGHASGAGLYPDGGGCPGCAGYNDPPSWDLYSIPGSSALYPWNVTDGNSSMALPEAQYPDALHPDSQTAAFIIAQLKAQGGSGRPFFFAPGFLKPHLPFIFPARFLDWYANYSEVAADEGPVTTAPAPPLAFTGWGELRAYADIAALIAADGINLNTPDTAIMPTHKAIELRRGYLAATSFNDALVGQVLDALEESGFAGNTTVVLWGDHGWMLGDHRDWTKHTNYESATRAPLLIRSPAYPQSQGRTITALTQHIDIFPTLLELAGLGDSPAATGLQGHSLVPLLQDPSSPFLPARPYAYSQYPRKTSPCPGFECDDAHAMGYTIRTPQWRFTQWVDYSNATYTPNFNPATSKVFAQELYSHNGDSDGSNWTGFELHNLAGNPDFAEVVRNLTALLHAGPNLLHPTQGGV